MSEPLSVRATVVVFAVALLVLWILGVAVEASTQYGSMIP